MNILNCTVCFPEYVQNAVSWAALAVPSLITENSSIPINIFLSYSYYVYPIYNSVTVVPELSIWSMLLTGLAIIMRQKT